MSSNNSAKGAGSNGAGPSSLEPRWNRPLVSSVPKRSARSENPGVYHSGNYATRLWRGFKIMGCDE